MRYFLVGLALVVLATYLLMEHVVLVPGVYYWFPLAIDILPIVVGLGLFAYGKHALGLTLAGVGALVILVAVLANMHLRFRPTTFSELVLMVGALAIGLGLMGRSLLRSRP